MDDMAVVDDMNGAAAHGAALRCPTAWQRQHWFTAEETLDPVIPRVRPTAGPRAGSYTHAQPMADQPRWHRVEHAAKQEAAAAGDDDQILFEVGGAARWQRREQRTLDLQLAAPGCIGTTHDLGNEAAIERHVSEVTAAAKQQ
jgi:hypothetical protein